MSKAAQQQQAAPTGNGAPASSRPSEPEGAMNTRQAASALEDLLTDDGHSPDHGSSRRDQDDPENSHRDDEDTDDDNIVDQIRDTLDDDASDDVDDDSDTSDEDTDDDDADDDSDDSDTDDDTIQTFDELAEALEMDTDELKALKLSFKAAGENVTLPIEEIVAGYQKDSDYRRQTAELAEERREFQATARQQTESFVQESTVLAQVMGNIEASITQSLNSPEMQALRASDPGEWTARQTEAEKRLNGLRNFSAQAAQQYQKFTTDAQKAFLQEQGRRLNADPDVDWNAETMKEVSEGIMSFGFEEKELPNIMDARLVKPTLELIALRKEVAELRAQKTKGKAAASKIKTDTPKITVKPGSKKRGGIKRSDLQKAKDKVRRTAKAGGRENLKAAASAIEQMLVPSE